jgi:hypothetical protein
VPKGGVEGEKVGESDAVLRSCGLSGLREGDPAQAPPPESSSWLEEALTALGGVYRVYSPIFSKAALATGVGLVLADDALECGERRLGVSSHARMFLALVALRRPEATLTPPVMLSSLRTISSVATRKRCTVIMEIRVQRTHTVRLTDAVLALEAVPADDVGEVVRHEHRVIQLYMPQ